VASERISKPSKPTDNLIKTWHKIEEKQNREGPGSCTRTWASRRASSDLFRSDISRVVVDSKKLHGEIREYLAEVAPGLLPKVELYRDHSPLFDHYKIEDQIEKCLSRKIWLKRGGSIVFDQAEAMTVIDVNSGRSVGHRDHELNAYETDLEAAREIGRQLRLGTSAES
jgi:ribonuclease G